jgi:DNA-binding transcriptional MerR regulator
MATVSQLAKQANVTADAIRHYVRIGLLKPQRDSGNGYKQFTTSDVDRVRFIRNARSLGYTLSEIGLILKDTNKGDSPCPRVRKLIQKRIDENRKKIEELRELQARMEEALHQWAGMPDGNPDGTCICHLIEAITAVPGKT